MPLADFSQHAPNRIHHGIVQAPEVSMLAHQLNMREHHSSDFRAWLAGTIFINP
jgi:hypothetical protein